mmetsp:Transcript_43659/g.70942  ORF Transcript_43659/g.70942 Transcript_43659/m.70942 type:complete len:81 (-) Transcript_43659:842-1084(-)
MIRYSQSGPEAQRWVADMHTMISSTDDHAIRERPGCFDTVDGSPFMKDHSAYARLDSEIPNPKASILCASENKRECFIIY